MMSSVLQQPDHDESMQPRATQQIATWLTWSTATAMSKYVVTANAVMPNDATRMVNAMRGDQGPKASETASGTESDPANVAGLVGFLASDAAAELNDQIFYSQG